MTRSPRPLHRLASVFLLTVLAPPQVATAAAPRAAGAAPTSARADDGIIPLPLNPVVPASQRVCAARTSTGLGYTMLRPASGPKPAETDVVLVNYIGYLEATGAVFDQGMQAAFPVNGVIKGFSQGLQMMATSGIARFCIPAALGYGDRASGPIPANSDLVFQVELVDHKSAAEIEAMNNSMPSEPAPPQAPPARQ